MTSVLVRDHTNALFFLPLQAVETMGPYRTIGWDYFDAESNDGKGGWYALRAIIPFGGIY